MRTLAVIAFIFIIVPLLLLAAGQFGLLKGRPPSEPGLREGKLKPPSRTQNSVSSQASLWPAADYAVEYAAIEPLAFTQDSALAMNRLRDVLAAGPVHTSSKTVPNIYPCSSRLAGCDSSTTRNSCLTPPRESFTCARRRGSGARTSESIAQG